MSLVSRRSLILGGFSAVIGAAGLKISDELARRYGLLPPDSHGIYGPGESLTYAAQRLLGHHAYARELSPKEVTKPPYAYGKPPAWKDFAQLKRNGFASWQLQVSGLVNRPMVFSLHDLKSLPASSQVTTLACEEGWSYVAQWTGVPLLRVLEIAGIQARAKYVVYYSIQPNWWESVDMDDALHPQTLLTYGMNGGDLPIGNGGPLRMRVPRQLGYKSIKWLQRLVVTDDLKKLGNGLGSGAQERGYAWYAGL